MSNEPWAIRLGSRLMAHSSMRKTMKRQLFNIFILGLF